MAIQTPQQITDAQLAAAAAENNATYSVVSQGGIVVSASPAAIASGVVVGQATPPTDVVLTSDGIVNTTPQSNVTNDPLAFQTATNNSIIATIAPQSTVTNESDRVQAILDTNYSTPEKSVTAEDPMAAALAANQASNEETSPTEQAVINASDEPRLSASDQAALEDQQAANRASLQQEDATNQAATVLIKPGSIGNITSIPDWRVKLSLAKQGANYLYNAANVGEILYPLKQAGGVVFPYTPQIQTSYKASYDNTDLVHSNYKMHFYRSSHVEDIQITCDFTAQDSNEASYMLAVIHFFKSVTKMFYGQDSAPAAGTPPPLVFLSGYGQYQFNHHPMLISSFTYNLPNDVDYIRASTGSNVSLTGNAGASAAPASNIPGLDFIKSRLLGANLNKGGASSQPTFTLRASGEPTYVPTKIQIQLTCLPVVTRNDISKTFSLKDYAAGNLTKRSTGGIW
jgi:hypothetical protein